MPETITSLIEKLEGAEAGSRELDREVWLACRQPEKWGGPINPPGKGVWEGPHVSYSLDAALALAERVLGEGWSYSIIGEIGCGAAVTLEQPDVDMGGGMIASPGLCGLADFEGESSTPALALCAAISRATGEDSPANEGEGR